MTSHLLICLKISVVHSLHLSRAVGTYPQKRSHPPAGPRMQERFLLCKIRVQYQGETCSLTPHLRLASHYSLCDLGFRSLTLNSSSLDSDPITPLLYGYRRSPHFSFCGCWAPSPPALMEHSACLKLLLLFHLSFYLDSSGCPVCLNFELLTRPSSLVLPTPTAPLRQNPDFCFPTWTSHPDTH